MANRASVEKIGIQGDVKFNSKFISGFNKSHVGGLTQQMISVMICISQGTANYNNLFTVCDCDILAQSFDHLLLNNTYDDERTAWNSII